MVVPNLRVGKFKRARKQWRCEECGGMVLTVVCLVCDLRKTMRQKETKHLVQKAVKGTREAARRDAARSTSKPVHKRESRQGTLETTALRGQRKLTSVDCAVPVSTKATKTRKAKREETMKIDCVGHIKTLKLKRELQLPRWQVIGLLETLFNFAMINADDGGVGRYSNDEIALYMEYFDDADKLVAALETSGFLEPCEENRLKIHDWAEHAPKFLKDRLDKRAKRNGDTPRQDATDCDTTRQDAAGSEKSEEIAPSIVKPIEDKPLDSVSLNSNPVTGESQIEPTEEQLLQLIKDWNEKASQHPKRMQLRASHKVTPKLLRQIDQLPLMWFEQYKTALTPFPLPCFDYPGAWRPNFDWFVGFDKKERIVVQNILDGLYDFLPDDGREAREQAIEEEVKRRRNKATASAREQAAVYAKIAKLKREGKGNTAECELLKHEYAQMTGG